MVMNVKMPDGTIIQNVPDNYSQQDLLAQYQMRSQDGQTAPTTTQGGAAVGVYPQMSGVRSQQDPERAKDIPAALVKSGVAGALSPLAAIAQFAGYDQPAEVLQKMKQSAANMSYPVVANIGSTAGELLNPAPYAAFKYASKLPSAIGKSDLARAGIASGVAGLFTPTTPTTNTGDFATQKAEQVGESALVGGALGKAGQMIMNPNVSPELQKLKDMGMKYFTPAQLSGSEILKNLEKKLTSLPIAGSFIGGAMNTVNADLNKAVANKVVEPLGFKIPENIPAGEETNKYISEKIADAYKAVSQNANLIRDNIDVAGRNVAGRLEDMMHDLKTTVVPSDAQRFERNVRQDLIEPINKAQIISGKTYRTYEKKLGEYANEAYKTNDDLGRAYENMLMTLREELKNQNPAVRKLLEQTNEVFKTNKILQDASSRAGTEGGIYTPQILERSVERKAGQEATAKGQGKLKDVSNAAMSVIGPSVSDSGTAGRAAVLDLIKGLTMEGGVNYLGSGIPIAASALMYNKPAMRVANVLATERPQFMKTAQPYVSGALSALGGAGTANVPTERKLTE